VSNNLSGSIPNEINYFTDLETLDLYYNKLTGSIPDLSQLINLRQFDVDGNMLSGMAPESLFNLPSIVNMYLLNNKDLTGTIPNIGDSSRLEKISVLGCSFTGSIPQSLSALSTLRLLQLKDNAITGTIPAGLLSLPELETLGLHGNRLVGSIPSIDAVTGSALRSLSLGSNSLEGSLPDGIEALTALQFLYAHDNALTGTVRNEIMALPLLEQLWLYKNKLTGEIPALSSSGNLVDLFLSDNDLSGNLQDLLASAPTSIERIDVSNNDLGGFISDDIIQLTKVQTFAVAGNKLTGLIPENIMNMISLTSFDFSQNSLLEGDLTSSICKTTAISNGLIFAAADCSGGDPIRVKCDCCTECCDRSGECTPNNND
jgi:Leucine-rich repeat (LRR) protein